MMFAFVDDPAGFATPEDFLIAIPAGIQTKTELLAHYERAGAFPYFGHNWDALHDCLHDFSWIDQDRIVIVHTDMPLTADEDGQGTYLEILADAVVCKESAPSLSAVTPRKVHELVVVFPAEWQEAVSAQFGWTLPRRNQ